MSNEAEIERKARAYLERCMKARSKGLAKQLPSLEYALGNITVSDPLAVSAERHGGYSPLELIGIRNGYSRTLETKSERDR